MPHAIEPHPGRPGVPLVPLLLMSSFLMPIATSAAPLCSMPDEVGPKAAPIGLATDGDDLLVELVTDPSFTHVVLRLVHDQQGSVFTTPAVVDVDGRVTATLFGALYGADTRAIGYHLSATDLAGTPLMEPYPLSVMIECPGAGATYSLIPGVSTTGLLMTRAFADALDAMPPCEIPSHALQLLDHRDPAVCAGARTLLLQLDLLGVRDDNFGTACRHAWRAVVPRTQNTWITTAETEVADDGSATLGQLGGLDSGAASCFGLQGTSLTTHPFEGVARFPDQLWTPPTHGTVRGATQVEQSILCLVGGGACEGSCTGTVTVGLDTASCVSTQALSCDEGSQATSTASHDWRLSVDGVAVPMGAPVESMASVDTKGVVETTFASAAHRIEPLARPAPVEVRLEGMATLGVGVSSPSLDATSYGFAETNSTYTLSLEASGATCTESATVSTRMTTPALPEARLDGGLKMKRWWPDGESETWFVDGWSGPKPPAVCKGFDLSD